MLRLSRLGFCFVVLALLLALPTATGAGPLPAPLPASSSTSSWTGEYYNNIDLSGSPVQTREDTSVNFFWPEYTSPIPGIMNVDHYSVRWKRNVNFDTTGRWTFTSTNDDGMRVWVDNTSVIDAWYDQGPTNHSGTILLTAGTHDVRIEYYNHVLGGTAQVSYTLTTATSLANCEGEYFNNATLSGTPVLTRDDPGINFDWGSGSPDASIPPDNFSVRWTCKPNLSAGDWHFTVRADDGVRLWVDSTLLIDKWVDQSVTTYMADQEVTAGTHTLKIEYYEHTVNGVAQLNYNPIGLPPTGVWRGQYFNNPSLGGMPLFVRDDQAVNFEWGSGSPDPGLASDNFSVRWDSIQKLTATGNYAITVTSDDGVRVWLDGSLVVDAWYDHTPATFTVTRWLGAAEHSVRIEYYERSGNAQVRFQMGLKGAAATAGPTPPGGIVTVDDGDPGWRAGGFATAWQTVAKGIGGQARWVSNHDAFVSGYNWGRWYPSLGGAGNYEVSVHIPGGVADTGSAKYWIKHNDRYDSAVRNQGLATDQWVSLGTFYFGAIPGAEYVSLNDVTSECSQCRKVVFDAARFSPR